MARQLPLLLLHFFFVLAITANVAIASSSNVLPANCTDKCGNVSIPYPFGIGPPRCFREGFEITCEEEKGEGVPYLGDVPLTEIFLAQGQVSINMLIGRMCFNASGVMPSQTQQPELYLSNTPFKVSAANNTFIAIGCDTFAYISGFNGYDYVAGCLSSCGSLDSVNENDTCTGSGCCEISIPKNLDSFDMYFPDNFNHSTVFDFNPCSYAFVVEKDWFNFSSAYLGDLNWDRAPMMLDWIVGSENCSEAPRNTTSYACLSVDSTCIDSTNGDGYFCGCNDGYQGNPYLQDGCQDIDECQNPELYPCNATCTNTNGSYSCSCGLGEHSNGTTCVPDPKSRLPLWVKVALGTSCGLVTLAVLSLLMCMKCQKRKLSKEKKRFFQQNGGLILYEEIKSTGSNAFKIFRKEELEKATKMFDENLILGHGGHGTVYMGTLEGNISVAIKKSRVIDENQKKEFVKEILILSQVNHRNVVKILGCCLEVEVPMLVYEFVSNGTLLDYIHGKNQKQPISFDTRLRIAAESAEALAYLHSSASPPILHGDVKSSNILLDENHVAKVSDFGASTLLAMDEIQIATMVQGTIGYLDPEYMQTYVLTEKSDVYSFGVVLLELLTGKKAFYVEGSKDEKCLASIFLSVLKENRLMELLDNQVKGEGYIELVYEVSELARQCLNIKGEERPTMKEVAEGLQTLRRLTRQQSQQQQHPSEELQSLLGESPTYDVVSDTGIYSFGPYGTRSVLNVESGR